VLVNTKWKAIFNWMYNSLSRLARTSMPQPDAARSGKHNVEEWIGDAERASSYRSIDERFGISLLVTSLSDSGAPMDQGW
jgi:hypothetical protein